MEIRRFILVLLALVIQGHLAQSVKSNEDNSTRNSTDSHISGRKYHNVLNSLMNYIGNFENYADEPPGF